MDLNEQMAHTIKVGANGYKVGLRHGIEQERDRISQILIAKGMTQEVSIAKLLTEINHGVE